MMSEREKESEKIGEIAWCVLWKLVKRILLLIIIGFLCWGATQFGLGCLAAYQDVAEGMSCVKANVKMAMAGWRLTDQFTLVQSRGYNLGYQFYVHGFTDYLYKKGVKRIYEDLKKKSELVREGKVR